MTVVLDRWFAYHINHTIIGMLEPYGLYVVCESIEFNVIFFKMCRRYEKLSCQKTIIYVSTMIESE